MQEHSASLIRVGNCGEVEAVFLLRIINGMDKWL